MTTQKHTHKSWDPEQTFPATFFQVATSVYQNDPHWIPEQEEEIRHRFSKDNPFFENCEALILVEADTRAVGFYNPSLRIHDEAVAFFGYWETANDIDTNKSLFDNIIEWARERGAKRLYGPINFNTYSNYRVRSDGFDRTPFPGEPYNPEYYPKLLEQLGFQIAHHFSTSVFETDYLINYLQEPITSIRARAESQNIRITNLTADYWMANLRELYQVVDTMFKDNFAYTPISFGQFESVCGLPFAKKLCPKTSVLLHREDGIIGFQLSYPHYGELVSQGSEQTIMPSDLNYSSHFNLLKQPRKALGKTLAVLPKFRSQGLFYLLMHEAALRAKGLYQYCCGAMVRDDNHSAAVKRFAQENHHYALYYHIIN